LRHRPPTTFIEDCTLIVQTLQIGNLKKIPPIGREGVYDENSDFRGKKTNRIEKKDKVY
jgi:hypothetical protein